MHKLESVRRGRLVRPLCTWLCAALALGPVGVTPTFAAAPAAAPQVLLAVTNSESMDGTTSGAIMTGSGLPASGNGSLVNSSSPVNYTIPAGFTPPLGANPVPDQATARYTVACGSLYCDNGPSRMNLAKAAISSVLSSYGDSLNFGLYAYSTGTPTLYTTWVYQMSASGGFTFSNTASGNSVANPCFRYASASTNVNSVCTTLAGRYGSSTLGNSTFVNIGASSDDPAINDVLYAGSGCRRCSSTTARAAPPRRFLRNRTLSELQQRRRQHQLRQRRPVGRNQARPRPPMQATFRIRTR